MSDEVERWPDWWARLYAFFGRDPVTNREVVGLLEPGPGDTVLDIGCGAGAAVRRASDEGAEAIGIDPSPGMVAAARRRTTVRPGVRFEVGHAAELPLDDDAVSMAWAIETFHHWPDRRAGLAEVHRVVAPGGRLVLFERRLGRLGSHGLAAREAETTATDLEAAGWTDVSITTHRPRLLTFLAIRATA